MITDYSTLKQAVMDWLNRPELSGFVPDFVRLGELWINRNVKCLGNLVVDDTSVTLTNGVQTADVQSDLVDVYSFRLDISPSVRLQYMPPVALLDKYSSTFTGTPKFFSILGTKYLFGPIPDSNYSTFVTYYSKFPTLSDTVTTNWLTANAPDLLLYAALVAAEPFLYDDPRVTLWKALLDQAARDVAGLGSAWSVAGVEPAVLETP
jgi:hypothetical protein